MNIKTSELTGAALDWAVAKCELDPSTTKRWVMERHAEGDPMGMCYSTDWLWGGPIIERERLCLKIGHDGVWLAYSLQNYADEAQFMHSGPTPLVAAMRCFVASKLGDIVEVPDELKE